MSTALDSSVERRRKPIKRFGDSEYLSVGERRILGLAVEGYTDKEISREIGLSISTIRTYWTRLRVKLGVVNRAQAIASAIETEVAGQMRIVDARVQAMHVMLNSRGIGIWEWDSTDDKVTADEICARIFCAGGAGSRCSLQDFVAALPTVDRDNLLRFLQERRSNETITHRIRRSTGVLLASTRVTRVSGDDRVLICTTETVTAG